MLSLPPRRLACAFALSLLCLMPLVRAQTPAAKPDAPPQVRLQVSFISASKVDVDNLGITFEPAPAAPVKGQPEPQMIQMRTATGKIISELYQTLTQNNHRLLSVPEVVTPNKVSAKFAEDTEIPYLVSHTSSDLFGALPAEEKRRRLQTSLSITPRINADGSVTLVFVPLDGDLHAPPKAIKVPTAKTVASGQVIALSGLPFSSEKPTDDEELLVFVIPTVLNTVPQVRLQVNFVSASKTDVDNLGVAFDPVLLTTSASRPLRKGTVLGASTDNIVTQLFQTLTRMRGSLVSSPIIVTDGKMPVTFSVNTEIRYHPYRVTTSSIGDPRLEETVPMPLQAALIVTPHVNSDGSVTLTLVPQAGDINASPAGPRAAVTQTIASGQMLVLSGLPTSKEKPTDDQELLVFVTPTVLSADASPTIPKSAAASVVNTGQPTVPDTAESKTDAPPSPQ